GLGRSPEEVAATLPVHLVISDEPQVCLVHEVVRVERVIGSLPAKLRTSHPQESRVDGGHEAVEGLGLPAFEVLQELCDGGFGHIGSTGRYVAVCEPPICRADSIDVKRMDCSRSGPALALMMKL